jgi:Eukaryotic phosphomannomutase
MFAAVVLFIQVRDKTLCLRFLDDAAYDEVHLFGDKTFEVCNTVTTAISSSTILVLLYSILHM